MTGSRWCPLVQMRAAAVLSGLIVALVACGGDGDTGSATSTTAPATTTTTPLAGGEAPSVLEGRWRTVITGSIGREQVTLTLRGTSYTISRGPYPGTGSLSVRDDRVEFVTYSAATRCEGVATYRWSVRADELTLELVGRDPCPNRAQLLADHAFERL